MDFDRSVDRRGQGSAKWDAAEQVLGLPAGDGLPMWVADMDFEPAPVIVDELTRLRDQGFFGYFSTLPACSEAVAAWMQRRHGWSLDPDHILYAHSIGNAVALCLSAYTAPGDSVVITTPVYHEFANKIRRAGRSVRELPLATGTDGTYQLDLDAWEGLMTGTERAFLLSSPHNPAGRVWTRDELIAIAEFCARHDMLLISDEIHHDLVLPGHTHIPAPVALPDHSDRLVVLTSASKAFNLAGSRTGCISIADDGLRGRMKTLIDSLDIQPNMFGVNLMRAAYSDAGAEWIDALCAYIAENCRIFAEGVGRIPGLDVMPMQSTYLAWVDFSDLGMSEDELTRRIVKGARVGPSPGLPFGTGGAGHRRFNLGTQRARVELAMERLAEAFADVQ